MTDKFLNLVKEKARAAPARILFPETFDWRTLGAVAQIVGEKTARPILIGDPKELKENFEKAGLNMPPSAYEVIDMKKDSARRETYARDFFELRKNKGVTEEQATQLMSNLNYFAVMAVKTGDVDGLISGANSPTGDTLRPALQIIKTKERFRKVSAFFFMVLEERLLLFADCAVNIEPNSRELADIAIDTAETAKRFGIFPRIAMLSFSTNGSAKHPNADRVREAAQMVKHFRPEIPCEGEMQVDAALIPEVCARKFPKSTVPGNANILIFPSLESANIAYKLVERLAKAEAIGPVLQGLQKPINDLSRGCSVKDIVDLAAITSVEAQGAAVDAGKLYKD